MLQAKQFYKAKRVLYHTLSHFFWKIHSQQLTKFEEKKSKDKKIKYKYIHTLEEQIMMTIWCIVSFNIQSTDTYFHKQQSGNTEDMLPAELHTVLPFQNIRFN